MVADGQLSLPGSDGPVLLEPGVARSSTLGCRERARSNFGGRLPIPWALRGRSPGRSEERCGKAHPKRVMTTTGPAVRVWSTQQTGRPEAAQGAPKEALADDRSLGVPVGAPAEESSGLAGCRRQPRPGDGLTATQ